MKRMFGVVILLVLISCNENNSDDQEQEQVTNQESESVFYFSGKLDHKYEIYMKLQIPDDRNGEVNGEYFYSSQKKMITLTGDIADGRIELDESAEGKNTGHFDGKFENGKLVFYSGIWTNSDKSKSMEFNLDAEHEDVYVSALNGATTGKGPLSWSEFRQLFEKVTLPFDVNTEKSTDELEMLDTNTVNRYFFTEGEDRDTWGWNEYYPRYRFETDLYTGIIVEHFYSPGVGGINDSYIELFTYSKEGEKIDGGYIGCVYCSDTNYDDYFEKSDKITFKADGTILVNTKTTHASELSEDDPNYFEAEHEYSTTAYHLSKDGKTTEIKDAE